MKKLFILYAFCSVHSACAYNSEDISNAHYLADQQIVVKQTTDSKYRLDDKILRQEVIGMALKVKGITLPENYTCKKYFADATKNDWVCRAVELAADNGVITRSNKYANPGKSVTRAEALAMVMSAGGYNAPSGATPPIFPYSDVDISSWQSDVTLYAAGLWIITNPNVIPLSEWFKMVENIKPIKFYPNRLATRAEVFGFAKNMIAPGLDKTFSNNLFSFKYPSRYLDFETKTISQITLQELESEVLVGGVPIFYYTNIISDADILNILWFDLSKSCELKIREKTTLSSWAILINLEFSNETDDGTMCGRNFVSRTLFFPSKGLLIDIHFGQGFGWLTYWLGNITFDEFIETFQWVE